MLSGNLVILQTLSKAWGLAGIRLGMVFAQPEVIGYLSVVKYPYNINTLTIEAAKKQLANEQDYADWIKSILDERALLAKLLGSFPFVKQVFPSDANFLLVRVEDPGKVYTYLMQLGIIVRDRSSLVLCEDCLRISVGTEIENKVLIEALSSFDQKDM